MDLLQECIQGDKLERQNKLLPYEGQTTICAEWAHGPDLRAFRVLKYLRLAKVVYF